MQEMARRRKKFNTKTPEFLMRARMKSKKRAALRAKLDKKKAPKTVRLPEFMTPKILSNLLQTGTVDILKVWDIKPQYDEIR